MCMTKGAPKKPSYGPCCETHGFGYTTTGGIMYSGITTATTATIDTTTRYCSMGTATAATTGTWTSSFYANVVTP